MSTLNMRAEIRGGRFSPGSLAVFLKALQSGGSKHGLGTRRGAQSRGKGESNE